MTGDGSSEGWLRAPFVAAGAGSVLALAFLGRRLHGANERPAGGAPPRPGSVSRRAVAARAALRVPDPPVRPVVSRAGAGAGGPPDDALALVLRPGGPQPLHPLPRRRDADRGSHRGGGLARAPARRGLAVGGPRVRGRRRALPAVVPGRGAHDGQSRGQRPLAPGHLARSLVARVRPAVHRAGSGGPGGARPGGSRAPRPPPSPRGRPRAGRVGPRPVPGALARPAPAFRGGTTRRLRHAGAHAAGRARSHHGRARRPPVVPARPANSPSPPDASGHGRGGRPPAVDGLDPGGAGRVLPAPSLG